MKDAGEYAWDLVQALERAGDDAIVAASYKTRDVREFDLTRRAWDIIETHIKQVIEDHDRQRKGR